MTISRACSRIGGLFILVSLALAGGSLGSPGGTPPTISGQAPVAFYYPHPANHDTPMAQGDARPMIGLEGTPDGAAVGNNSTQSPGLVNGTTPSPEPVPIPVPCSDARAGGFVELGDTQVTFGSMVRDPSLAKYACDVELDSARMHALQQHSEHARHPWANREIPNPPGVGAPGPTPQPTDGHTWDWKPVGHHHGSYTLTARHDGTMPR